MSNITEKSFDSQAIFKNKYLKVKLKYYEGKNNTCFLYIKKYRKKMWIYYLLYLLCGFIMYST